MFFIMLSETIQSSPCTLWYDENESKNSISSLSAINRSQESKRMVVNNQGTWPKGVYDFLFCTSHFELGVTQKTEGSLLGLVYSSCRLVSKRVVLSFKRGKFYLCGVSVHSREKWQRDDLSFWCRDLSVVLQFQCSTSCPSRPIIFARRNSERDGVMWNNVCPVEWSWQFPHFGGPGSYLLWKRFVAGCRAIRQNCREIKFYEDKYPCIRILKGSPTTLKIKRKNKSGPGDSNATVSTARRNIKWDMGWGVWGRRQHAVQRMSVPNSISTYK